MTPFGLDSEKHMALCGGRSKVTAGPVFNSPVPYCNKYCTVPEIHYLPAPPTEISLFSDKPLPKMQMLTSLFLRLVRPPPPGKLEMMKPLFIIQSPYREKVVACLASPYSYWGGGGVQKFDDRFFYTEERGGLFHCEKGGR